MSVSRCRESPNPILECYFTMVRILRRGRSLRTRVHPEMGITDRAKRYYRVGPGKYRIELQVAGETFVAEATVLSDDSPE